MIAHLFNRCRVPDDTLNLVLGVRAYTVSQQAARIAMLEAEVARLRGLACTQEGCLRRQTEEDARVRVSA